jgi:tetratricopeptide (TPR) repeat protein
MEVARYFLKSQGGGDALTRAELDRFEGSLRRAQRRFDEARDLFSRAVMAFALEGKKADVTKTLLALGPVLRETGEVDRAVEVANQALEIAQEERLQSLELIARHNLALALHYAGAHEEARRIFEDSAELYEEQGDPPILLRRTWLGGHLARAEGDLQAAESAYRMVRDGFIRQGVAYDAALAALDLATLYAECGRVADLKRVAEEIIPVFEAQDVHREAAAALMLFQDAVRAEQVTLRYVIELSRYLERARLDPTLAFQRPA